MIGDDFNGDMRLMQGSIRLLIDGDKFYVAGEGMLIPVKSYQEGADLINEIEEKVKGREL